MADRDVRASLDSMLRDYVGRTVDPAVTPALSERVGARVYRKREDLNHTGAHKINNTVGQVLPRSAHGEASHHRGDRAPDSTAWRRLPCARGSGSSASCTWAKKTCGGRRSTSSRMRLMGATVVPVTSGTRTLKDATTEAIRDWVTNVNDTHYIIGSVVRAGAVPAHGPRFSGGDRPRGAREQMLSADGRLAEYGGRVRRRRLERHGVFAGSSTIPTWSSRRSRGGGEGLDTGRHSASLSRERRAYCTGP